MEYKEMCQCGYQSFYIIDNIVYCVKCKTIFGEIRS